ncbi:putative C6 transcription factor [Talaromyces proteolyticus]|uniref:C6 transcription factor n=1 Tax=Talaromyces proteolyticus TaxID=1131652 RepID=A0AAD4L1D0_9EURO|nr:putative C6 transcription factor [Talaromyces proteolyticus]KAH8702326.1 putative C6 transcription factor [Talaromyces proteolyticus]
MVYRGKPSRSCRECRRRDIKCDKKPNGCSQCSRAAIQCSRYPDPTQLIIYDETKSTINKRQKRKAPLNRSSPLPDPLSIVLLPSWETRAKRLFISQYVTDSHETNLFSYMRVFYPPQEGQSPLLETVIRSVWLAFYSFSHQSPVALHDARVNYGSALLLTTNAIQSPVEVNENRTLMSLLLLTVYERLINYGERNLSPPSNAHLRGALGLAVYQGDSQFSDPIRINILLGLVELIIIECLAHELDMPSDLLMLSSKVFGNVVASAPKWQFLKVLLEYAQLKERLRLGISSEAAISWAERLGCELEGLSQHLRPVTSTRQNGKRLHAYIAESSVSYPDNNTRRSWNNLRVLRMLLADVIREQCAVSLGSSDITRTTAIIEKLHDSTLTINTLCSDIYASASESSTAVLASENVSDLQTSTLFFQLYAANSCRVISDQLQKLLQKRLQSLSVGQFSGVRRLMTQLLQETDNCQPNLWQAWLRLGKERFSIDTSII